MVLEIWRMDEISVIISSTVSNILSLTLDRPLGTGRSVLCRARMEPRLDSGWTGRGVWRVGTGGFVRCRVRMEPRLDNGWMDRGIGRVVERTFPLFPPITPTPFPSLHIAVPSHPRPHLSCLARHPVRYLLLIVFLFIDSHIDHPTADHIDDLA